MDRSELSGDLKKSTYRGPFGSRSSGNAITTGSTIKTRETGGSWETGVTFVSSHPTDCDSITWVSLLSWESWSTLRTRATLGGGADLVIIRESVKEPSKSLRTICAATGERKDSQEVQHHQGFLETLGHLWHQDHLEHLVEVRGGLQTSPTFL